MKKIVIVFLCLVLFFLGVWLSDPLLNLVNSVVGRDLFITKTSLLHDLEDCRMQRQKVEEMLEKKRQGMANLAKELNAKDFYTLTKESLLSGPSAANEPEATIVLRPPSSEMLLRPTGDDDPAIGELKEGINSKVKAMLDVSRGILRQKVAMLNVELIKMNDTLQSNNQELQDKLAEVDAYKKELEQQQQTIGQLQGIEQDLKKAVQDLEMKIEDGRLRVNFKGDILFASGSHRLRAEGRRLLDSVVPVLQKSVSENDIFVAGHTDNVPIKEAYRSKYDSNWDLSTYRAIEVVKYLIDKGLAPQHLTAAGFGEYKPLVDNDTEVHRARNRRVELFVAPRLFRRSTE